MILDWEAAVDEYVRRSAFNTKVVGSLEGSQCHPPPQAETGFEKDETAKRMTSLSPSEERPKVQMKIV